MLHTYSDIKIQVSKQQQQNKNESNKNQQKYKVVCKTCAGRDNPNSAQRYAKHKAKTQGNLGLMMLGPKYIGYLRRHANGMCRQLQCKSAKTIKLQKPAKTLKLFPNSKFKIQKWYEMICFKIFKTVLQSLFKITIII